MDGGYFDRGLIWGIPSLLGLGLGRLVLFRGVDVVLLGLRGGVDDLLLLLLGRRWWGRLGSHLVLICDELGRLLLLLLLVVVVVLLLFRG